MRKRKSFNGALDKLPQSGVVGNCRVLSPCGHLTLPIPPPFPQKSTAALSDKKHSVVPPSVFYLSLAYRSSLLLKTVHLRLLFSDKPYSRGMSCSLPPFGRHSQIPLALFYGYRRPAPSGREPFLVGKDRFLHQTFPLEREGVSGADG